MAILVFAETSEQQFKKSTLEAVSFAAELATKTSGPVIAVAFDGAQPESLGNYGANEVITVSNTGPFNAESYSEILAQVCKSKGAQIVVVSNSYAGKSISGRLAVKLQAAVVTNVIAMPDTSNGFRVKRS